MREHVPAVDRRGAAVVGISTIPRLVHSRFGDYPGQTIGDGFIAAVERAGGVPVLLPASAPAAAPAQVALLHGLILSGGSDVAPDHYGGALHDTMDWIDERRDRWELALLGAAEDHGLPILGVCRGCQLLNVFRGGTLHGHLDDALGHLAGVDDRAARHDVRLEPGSRAAAVASGALSLHVSSLHHQAIDRIGSGLVASGRADDGVVEAVEDPERDVLGVAWHPELQLAEPAGQPFFSWLVEAARQRHLELA